MPQFFKSPESIYARFFDPGTLLAALLIFSQLTIFWMGRFSKVPITIVIIFGLGWFFLRGKNNRRIYPVTALFIVIFCAITTWALVNLIPNPSFKSSLRLDVLAKLFSFIPIGWILYKREKFIFPFIVATVVGICAMPFTSEYGFNQFVGFLKLLTNHSGLITRYDFGFHSVDFSGMLFGFDLILLIFYWRRFIYSNGTLNYPTSILYVVLVSLSVAGLFASQARAAFLGLLVVCIVFVFAAIFKYWKNRRSSYATLFVPIIILLLTSISFIHIWQQRATHEEKTISRISNLNFNNIPMTSIGLRLYLIKIAVPAIMKRPLFGWGNEGSEIVINRSGLPPEAIKSTGHFHNVVLDILVRHGLIVFLTIVSVYIWFLFASRSAYINGIMPSNLYFFILAYFLYFLVVNQFDAYLLYSVGDIVNHSALAVALAYIFKAKTQHSGEETIKLSENNDAQGGVAP